MRKKVAVSACLAGKKCRYDGSAALDGAVLHAVENGKAVCGCPEAMAGLCIPREPAEIRDGDGFDVLSGAAEVYNNKGVCVTQAFLTAAQLFLEFVQKQGIDEVWLKAKSPSCGVHKIYDGRFEGTMRSGCGVTCALLIKNNIKVVEIP